MMRPRVTTIRVGTDLYTLPTEDFIPWLQKQLEGQNNNTYFTFETSELKKITARPRMYPEKNYDYFFGISLVADVRAMLNKCLMVRKVA